MYRPLRRPPSAASCDSALRHSGHVTSDVADDEDDDGDDDDADDDGSEDNWRRLRRLVARPSSSGGETRGRRWNRADIERRWTVPTGRRTAGHAVTSTLSGLTALNHHSPTTANAPVDAIDITVFVNHFIGRLMVCSS